MKLDFTKLVVAGFLAAMPMTAVADSIAVSLGATFAHGDDTTTMIDTSLGGGTASTDTRPMTIALSAASGNRVVASSVTNSGEFMMTTGSGAQATATNENGMIDAHISTGMYGAYETIVMVGDTWQELP